MDNKVIISVLVKNKRGALVRVSNVFSRRAINIIQLTVAETRNPAWSRITILVNDDGDLDHKQIDKQLRKIEYVMEAVILKYDDAISKELLLVKIEYDEDSLKPLQDKLFESSGTIISFNKEVVVGQIVGSSRRIDNFLKGISDFNVIEMSRSGITALNKSQQTFDTELPRGYIPGTKIN